MLLLGVTPICVFHMYREDFYKSSQCRQQSQTLANRVSLPENQYSHFTIKILVFQIIYLNKVFKEAV